MRLIDKELLLQRLRERKRPNPHGKDIRYYYWLELYNYVYDAPTVDALPVIRCKDCQYWMKNPYRESSVFGLCFKHKDIAIASDETDWCSWAERKEE